MKERIRMDRPMSRTRVLIVDDSAFMRNASVQILGSDPTIEVIGEARNGRLAVEAVSKLSPDVVTLDIEMPEMDGITALRRIMAEQPTRVIMLSSLTVEGSQSALLALKLGAMDVMAKPASQISLSINEVAIELVRKIHAVARSPKPRAPRAAGHRRSVPTGLPTYRPGQFDLVCIGSSTGGPPVLETILESLPPTFDVPVVVAQHMPLIFTKAMSDRLDRLCVLPVEHGEAGTSLVRGHVYVAPGGLHTKVRRAGPGRWRLEVDERPADAIFRPSVDALFESAARAVGRRVLAVILTGMGNDGLEGGRVLRESGGGMLAQSAETCTVYGMPKGLTEQGLVDASLDPESIGRCLARLAPNAAAA